MLLRTTVPSIKLAANVTFRLMYLLDDINSQKQISLEFRIQSLYESNSMGPCISLHLCSLQAASLLLNYENSCRSRKVADKSNTLAMIIICL
jgi:hypothetical protein